MSSPPKSSGYRLVLCILSFCGREEGDEEKELYDEDGESSAMEAETKSETASEPPVDASIIPSAAPQDPSLATENAENKQDWPSIGDLNARLRRVITAYQKNFRKEEIRQMQKARVSSLP